MPACNDRAVVEKLVRLIRDYPIIYDSSLPEHRDVEALQIVWATISEAMGISSLDGDVWKKKWRNLRDTYVKQKKEERLAKTNKSLSRKKPWRFTGIMKFLDKFIEAKSTESNFLIPPHTFEAEESYGTPDMSDDGSASFTERSSVVSAASQRTSNEQRDGSPGSPLPSQFPLAKKARHTDRNETDLYGNQWRRHEQHRFAPAEETDGDEAFFESCAHRIKKLPAQTRSFLKLQITQLFVNAENPEIPPLPITPLPHNQQSEHQHEAISLSIKSVDS